MDAILWDFDGVLMDSNAVRERGFECVLAGYPAGEVARLIAFHRENGGLSRYVKFRYFFESVRGEAITETEIQKLADMFSSHMRELLVDRSLLIEETMDLVRRFHAVVPMHIVSGSDQAELQHLCGELGIASFFRSIHGSPVAKIELVRRVVGDYGYRAGQCLLVGDSINDVDAARANHIGFVAYNNASLEPQSDILWTDFMEQMAELSRRS